MISSRQIRPAAVALCLGVAGWGASPVARAQGETEAIDFDAVFKRGFERYESDDYLGAARVWEQLLGTMGEDRGYKILYNLGLAYQAAGDASRAVERFDSFIQHLAAQTEPVTGPLEERRQDAAARMQAIKKSHGAVVVAPPARGGPRMVTVGAAAPRLAGFTVYLAPGAHRIEIGSGTPEARVISVDVKAGARTTVDTTPEAEDVRPAVTPAPNGPTRPLPPEKADDAPAFPTVWVLLGAGLTAASVAFPVVMHFRAVDAREEAETLPVGHSGYTNGKESFEGARDASQLSWILPAALGAITVGIATVGVVIVSTHDPDAPTTGGLEVRLGPLTTQARYDF